MKNPWTEEENRYIVADYIDMLIDELEGRKFNKTRHRKLLMPKLNNRTHGSIEQKHQNISAVLIENGYPYIDGYKPHSNYQRRNFPEIVLESIHQNHHFNKVLETDITSQPPEVKIDDILSIFEEAPILASKKSYDNFVTPSFTANSNSINYLAREANNRNLGLAGEKLVFNYERARLVYEGKANLSERVEHSSLEVGDGIGYDIKSYNNDGSDRFIEVKTTKYGKEIPFYISRNEVLFSEFNAKYYNLYRIYNFRKTPKMFIINGDVGNRFHLEAVTYRAYL